MSVFDPDSELSKINAAPAGQWLELSEPMRKVMKKAHEIYRLSGGAFDPTVGRLIDLWGFGVKKGNHCAAFSAAAMRAAVSSSCIWLCSSIHRQSRS